MSAAARLTPAVPGPAHVPEALVYDFDLHHVLALGADAHARVLDAVRTAPPGSGWTLSTHSRIMAGM